MKQQAHPPAAIHRITGVRVPQARFGQTRFAAFVALGAVGIALFLRHVLYLVFLCLRPLVCLIGTLVSPLCLLAGVFWGFAKGWQLYPCGALLVTGVVTFALAYLYDLLVLWISPHDIELYS